MANKKKTVKYIGVFNSNARGFGFVSVEGLEDDIFIPVRKTKGAFHMDEVEVEVLKPGYKGNKPEGRITNIVSHRLKEIVGTFDRLNGFGFVIPDNNRIPDDIFVSKEKAMGAVTGHKVVVRIEDYGGYRKKPEGEIIEILGHENDPGVDILSIIKGYELPTEFPEKVLRQAQKVSVEVTEADTVSRRDLRDTLMVTIDGEDSKDLDDAVSLFKENGIYHLGVHIADVSSYVKEESALDKEALKRGTSIYLVDRVIPMLPHALSNGICSLNMGEDRLALSCLMDIDGDGNVISHEIVESVINVDERMNYSDVNKIFDEADKNAGLHNSSLRRYEKELSMFLLMRELSDILHMNRKKRGSIDFDIPESKIILNKRGKVADVKPYERGTSQRIIEEFMLLANETVAEHFYWLDAPFVYRTHGTPDAEKILKLGAFINNFGYSIKVRGGKGDIHPKEIQKLLARIEGTSEEALISRLALRSMQRAEYNTVCSGHFGLAADYYCHFTSPIRRYPDLQIHRIIKEYLHGGMNEKRIEHYRAVLPQAAKASSELERRADEAEREVEKLKKCEYMSEHIGEEYEGVISGITDWGIYVELPSTIEGMIHISKLSGGYFYYKEDTYEMVGADSGITYKLGQRVKVLVDDVDIAGKTIDFLMCEE